MKARFLVSGRVQGVGFRYFVVHRARTLGLLGFTRNLPDGRVEVVAAGPEVQLEALEADLGRGPRAARVEKVEKFAILDEIAQFNSFDII